MFIGDSIVMMSDADSTNAPRPSVAFVFVPDVDVTFRKAIDCGCLSRREPKVAPWETASQGSPIGGVNPRLVSTFDVLFSRCALAVARRATDALGHGSKEWRMT